MSTITSSKTAEKSASVGKTFGDSVGRIRASATKNAYLIMAFLVLSALGLFLSGGEQSFILIEEHFGPLGGVDKAEAAKTARIASFAATSLLSLHFIAQVMSEKELEEENTNANTETKTETKNVSTTLSLKNVIGASRPPMWFATAFPYMLSATDVSMFSSPDFYVGLVYVTLPLNLFLCGLNDVMDWDVDHLSKKRASAWRQNLTKVQLEKLRRITWMIQVPFFLWSISIGDLQAGFRSSSCLWWLNASFQIALYNGGSSALSLLCFWNQSPAQILFLQHTCHTVQKGCFGLPHTSRIPIIDIPMNVWAWHLPVHFAFCVNGVGSCPSAHKKVGES